MEKHASTIICRLSAVFITLALTAVAASANSLLNPGFESAGSNATTAANWTQFGASARSTTNNTTVSVRSGFFSMQTVSPGTTNTDATGAYQDVPASSGQSWRLTGYTLTWQNDRALGPDRYGQAQLVFLDSSSNILQVVEGLRYGTDANLPVNTWVPFEVDATAPAGTAAVRTYVLYVGNIQDVGSIFYDDLNLYQPGPTPTTGSVTTQPAVQISWPTSSPTNGIDYQIQTTPDLVFTNLPAVNVVTNSSFETNAVPWAAFNGAGQTAAAVARTGTGCMRINDAASTVGGCDQIYSGITPGQVWDLQGYGYNWSLHPMNQPSTRGLLKIVWLNSSGATLAAVNGDTNLIGTIDSPPFAGVVSAIQMSSASPQNTWTLLEARATAPPGASQLQVFCLLVPQASPTTETCLFDDVIAFQPVSFNGWANLGPLWLGNSHTNQVYDLIGTNKTKFYRVITP
jgi:hypothetical protein